MGTPVVVCCNTAPSIGRKDPRYTEHKWRPLVAKARVTSFSDFSWTDVDIPSVPKKRRLLILATSDFTQTEIEFHYRLCRRSNFSFGRRLGPH